MSGREAEFVGAQRSLRAGIAYLEDCRRNNHWRGFPTLAGESDIWVTAFIAAHLRGLASRPVLAQARSFLLLHRGPSGMWSYGDGVPPDADSTAWCLMALAGHRGATGLPAAQRRVALAGIWRHARSDGVATFAADGAIGNYIGADGAQSIEGWTRAHPDVTAAAVLADAGTTPATTQVTLSRLIARQTGAGLFDAYWWRGPHYTTTLVLRALACHKRRLEPMRAKALLHAMEREQLPGGGFALGAATRPDAFTTALALESLVHLAYAGGAAARRAAAKALLDVQQPDGHWSGDYILRLPSPGIVDPRQVSVWTRDGRGGNSYVFDRDGQFATAMACHALALLPGAADAAVIHERKSWPILAAAPLSGSAESVEMFAKQV